ncbi:TonB-dependent receptor [Sphingosinicella rhizophila]|uniref:TonB-dependent receptor n=1 Tax=Sphingosinicella rhizophila TaxID=3050082 RepID=A0ABU3QBI7_9SPHN|nr:TonB-dependent receptor [Sphingosinicella sp. GR2756]MDT9600373.1 TonB-dependent receptor [Sphingosinicella sp. GR2756]
MTFKSKFRGLAGVALWAMATPLVAQATQPDETAVPAETAEAAAEAAQEGETITVTGTRIRGNFEAPTPVQAIGEAMIEQRGTTNIANVINELPAFTGSVTPSSTTLSSRLNGVNVLDLRGLGPNRNLILVNGRRGTPFSEEGYVDLNSIPSLAIDRVEVVTGGASAAYGSDAVSGVVNLIFDDRLEGLKLNAQFGISDEGDNENYRLSGAWGTKFGDGRGHFLIAGDYDKNKGIPRGTDREWQRLSPGVVAGTGGNAFQFLNNSKLFVGSPNGVTLPGGPAGNLEFFPDGTARPRELGENIGATNLMTGGSGSQMANRTAIVIPTERFNVLAAAHYDISDGVTIFGEASYAQSKSRGGLVDAFRFGIPIAPDNAYLPASVAALNTPIALFRTFEEVGTITSVSKNETIRFVGGLRGEFGNNWRWEVSGQYGQSDFSNDQENNLLKSNLSKAADAVRVGGNVVCRVNANASTTDDDPSCVPINLFGKGAPSQAALDYVFDTSVSDTRLKQTVFAAEIGGELFQGWAGPILGTVGAEYRKETLNRTVDASSAAQDFIIVNAQPLSGGFEATEAFAEIAIPILDGAQKLDFNGAARYTHYSSVGNVITWKAGLTFEPVDFLRFRGTISRDIRAPSISELFTYTLLFGSVTNPEDCVAPAKPTCGQTNLTQTPTVGNLGLNEEKATTKTIGAVLTLGGFKASVDYFDIKLNGAIGTLGAQQIVNDCFAGATELCSFISKDANGVITEVRQSFFNLDTYRLKGFDFEARYTTRLGNGTLGLGAVATYLMDKKIASPGGAVVDYAGEVGGVSGFGMPDFKATISANYDVGRFGFYAQARYIGSGVYDIAGPYSAPGGLSEEQNNVGSYIYVDLSARYNIGDLLGGGDTEIYAGVDNLFDRDPPIIPTDFISNVGTNASIYDVIGRKFFVGVRAKF